MLTAIEHNLELAQLLIEKGADINSRALHEDVRKVTCNMNTNGHNV